MQFTLSTSRANAKVVMATLGMALLASTSAFAKKSDRDQPADVVSKSVDGTQAPQNGQPGKVIWTTNVVLTQGTLKITGSKATGYLDGDNTLTRVVVEGSPATIHQLDDQNQPMDGRASNIDYKIDKDFAVQNRNRQSIARVEHGSLRFRERAEIILAHGFTGFAQLLFTQRRARRTR